MYFHKCIIQLVWNFGIHLFYLIVLTIIALCLKHLLHMFGQRIFDVLGHMVTI